MRVLLPLLFATAVASCASASGDPAQSRSAAAQVHWKPASIFEPHLSPCSRLRTTRGSLCAIGTYDSFWLDGGSIAAPMGVDEPGSVLVDATSWGKCCAELRVAKDDTVHIDADLGDGWRPRPLPAPVQMDSGSRSAKARCLAGAGDTLVFFANESIYRLERGIWSCVPLALGERKLEGAPQCALLEGRKLYLGLDGYLEGALLAVDIDTGATLFASDAFPPDLNSVTDLALGPDGKLYVCSCQPRMLGTAGCVLVQDGGSWKPILKSLRAKHALAVCELASAPVDPANSKLAAARAPILAPGEDATLPASYFLALAFDDEQRLCVLVDPLGIVRREPDGAWRYVTPGWPESGAQACDLAILRRTAMLAAGEAGVVLLDLETLEGQRVRMK